MPERGPSVRDAPSSLGDLELLRQHLEEVTGVLIGKCANINATCECEDMRADVLVDGFLIKCYSEKGADDSASLLDGEVEIVDEMDVDRRWLIAFEKAKNDGSLIIIN